MHIIGVPACKGSKGLHACCRFACMQALEIGSENIQRCLFEDCRLLDRLDAAVSEHRNKQMQLKRPRCEDNTPAAAAAAP